MDQVIRFLKKGYSWILKTKTSLSYEMYGDKNYEKYVIISRSRTGSTWLMTLLRYHPNLICEGEIFKHLRGKSCLQIWNEFFHKKPKRIKQVGFKLFYNHPYDQDQDVWDIIEADRDIRIIHLTRRNYLRSYLSEKIGEKTKKWTESIHKPDNLLIQDKKVTLDYEECQRIFERTQQNEINTRKRFRNHDFIEVAYEDLQENKEEVLSKIFGFLGVSFIVEEVPNKKQNPERISDLLINYKDLKAQLAKTQWRDFFVEL
ncbi:sulfotransferase [Autumnicola edwardsiae]|uniref:Sulfotransferase n=1 Tax=Autumnicola edwardsiae TaxID=3075594 RepID=A0ABU3CWY0_9FLAO|nr:sulfotransferase [Zunongwangia sp. F297]MDT0650821.1 sulfotransferase [Zunongwangia sp. F297]